jgi:hypothetical protein
MHREENNNNTPSSSSGNISTISTSAAALLTSAINALHKLSLKAITDTIASAEHSSGGQTGETRMQPRARHGLHQLHGLAVFVVPAGAHHAASDPV